MSPVIPEATVQRSLHGSHHSASSSSSSHRSSSSTGGPRGTNFPSRSSSVSSASTAPPRIASDTSSSTSASDSGYETATQERERVRRYRRRHRPATTHHQTQVRDSPPPADYSLPTFGASPDEPEPFIPGVTPLTDPPAAPEPAPANNMSTFPCTPLAGFSNLSGFTPMANNNMPVFPSNTPAFPNPAPVFPNQTPVFPNTSPFPFQNHTPSLRNTPHFPSSNIRPVIPGVTVPDPNAPDFFTDQHGTTYPVGPAPFFDNTPAVIPRDADFGSPAPIPPAGSIPQALHRHLSQHYNARPDANDGWCATPSMQWDIVHRPSDTARWLEDLTPFGTHEPDFNADAFMPNTPRVVQFTSKHPIMRFLFTHRPCVLTSYEAITVGQMLEHVFEYLHEPLTRTELEWIGTSPRSRDNMKAAMKSRYRDTLRITPDEGASFLRSDVMGGHRRFFGMELSSRPNGHWKVSVDFISGPVPRLWERD